MFHLGRMLLMLMLTCEFKQCDKQHLNNQQLCKIGTSEYYPGFEPVSFSKDDSINTMGASNAFTMEFQV